MMKIKEKKLFAYYFGLTACLCILLNFILSERVSAFNLNQSDRRVPSLQNLGNHHHAITTASAQAQRYFDQGLTLIFGFNHAEAWRSFQEAAQLDPDCGMCYWGISLSLGPHVNAPMGKESMPAAYEAIQKARQLAKNANPQEQAYIEALSQRYSAQPVDDRSSLDRAYANAMRQLAQQYPDDLDAATLFAESLMDLIPWSYWTQGGDPKPETVEILAALESVLERDPNHPGATHYYIHAVEASDHPEKAEAAADRLRHLVPDSGHLVHMPSHIYLRVGRYHDASVANQEAIAVDEAFLSQSQEKGLYLALYYPHNIHFLWSAATIEGRSQEAIAAARKLASKVSPEVVKQFPMTEIYLPTPYFSLVQFGKWDDVLTEPQPSDQFPYATAMWHYARGIAWAAKGNLDRTAAEEKSLLSFLGQEKIKGLDAMGIPATQLMQIADRLLKAKMGQNEEAIAQYQEAVKIQDSLPYMEPPYWDYPVRQSLGAALMQLERFQEAEAIYREDLQQHPQNGWSLWSLAQSLKAQGKHEEATQVQAQFEKAWSQADINLTASRF